MKSYLVTGDSRYLGFEPGQEFVGQLDAAVEARAIARGAIAIRERDGVSLDPTRASMPRGWDVHAVRKRGRQL